jgi:hypothetical protein
MGWCIQPRLRPLRVKTTWICEVGVPLARIKELFRIRQVAMDIGCVVLLPLIIGRAAKCLILN